MTRVTASPSDLHTAVAPSEGSPVTERRRSRAERRAARRLPLHVAVRQQVITPQGPVSATIALAQSSDLSLSGMRLWRRCSEDDPVIPAHTPVELAFELPGHPDLVELRGEVIFEEAQGTGATVRTTGVRFCEMPASLGLVLQEFLDSDPSPTAHHY